MASTKKAATAPKVKKAATAPKVKKAATAPKGKTAEKVKTEHRDGSHNQGGHHGMD